MNRDHDYFLTLCNLWCEQQISVKQLAELQTLLRSDAAMQKLFVEFIQLHGQLAWDAGVVAGSAISGSTREVVRQAVISDEPGSAPQFRRSRYTRSSFGMAAAALLVAGILIAGTVTINWQASDTPQVTQSGKNSDVRQVPDTTASLPELPFRPLELSGLKSDRVPSPVDPVSTDSAAGPDTGPDTGPTRTSMAMASTVDDASIISEIDRLVAAGWADNNVVAAQMADDHEWVRRCYLTLTGRIPTVFETSTFVNQASPRKRQELVDSLLNDPRYAENLSVTWMNLLIGRSNAANVNADALYSFLHRQFLKNRPWMETVGDLIAAEGRSDQNGATNFLLAHLNNQATPATAVTARLFLGQQVQCTQCHDHPFTKERQQDEFWSLNAFFKQAERRPLEITGPDGKTSNVWTLTDSGSPGMTFYETLRGQQKATLPEFDGHSMSADDARSRRAELVRLLAADSRQMVAQAMINRTWAQILGYGFTNPIDDLGAHNPVSHPELLELLTQSFVASDYDVRRLIRWLTLSQAFQLSSVENNESLTIDAPQNGSTPLFSRAYPRPMAPEQVYDSIRIAIRSAADQPIDSSIGSVHRREWVGQFVQSYGTDENDEQLAFEGNIVQAMLMMNGEDLQTAISLAAEEVARSEAKGPDAVEKLLNRIAMATLNREPSDQEEEVFLARYKSLCRTQSADQAIRTATEDMLWAYLNSSEFTSVH